MGVSGDPVLRHPAFGKPREPPPQPSPLSGLSDVELNPELVGYLVDLGLSERKTRALVEDRIDRSVTWVTRGIAGASRGAHHPPEPKRAQPAADGGRGTDTEVLNAGERG
jgi:hypothetical protein